MNFHVRRAKEGDIEAIVDNVVKMAEEGSGTKLDREIVSAGVSSLFKKPELGFYVVAELEKKIIGSLVIVFEWSDWKNGVRWWIHSVYVHSDHRRKGIYSGMYDYIKDEGQRDESAIGLNLSVHKNNNNARAVYEMLGMRKTSQVTYTDDSL